MVGSNTSVYIGSFSQDWADIGKRDSDSTPLYGATGSGATLLSNRLSYIFDFKGPSISVSSNHKLSSLGNTLTDV
jgi:acyl transferase domain-containing protein